MAVDLHGLSNSPGRFFWLLVINHLILESSGQRHIYKSHAPVRFSLLLKIQNVGFVYGFCVNCW